jgi:ABC-type glycerol-3-phosphate transport system substrate-binding protein
MGSLVEKLGNQIKKLEFLAGKVGQLPKKLGYLVYKLGHNLKKVGYFVEKLRYLLKKLRYRLEEWKYFGRKSKYLIRKLKYLTDNLRNVAGRLNGRKIVDISLGIAAAAVVVIITTGRSCETPGEPRSAHRIDITISSQSRDLFGGDTLDALIKEFEKQNPGLRIKSAAPDGQVADIVFIDDSGFNGLASNDYLHVETLVSFMDLLFYNIDILKAAKLDRPPKTRAEFLAAARAIAKNDTENPLFPFALGLHPDDTMALRRDFYPWVWANGGNIPPLGLSDEDITFSLSHTDIIAFFEQLNREELLAPGSFEKTGAQRLEEFTKGKIAMITASARDILFVQNNAEGITFGITTIPTTSQGKNRLGLLHIYGYINRACTVPNEARFFLDFIAEKSQVLAETLGAVPGSYPIAFPGEYITDNPLYSKAWDIFEAVDIVEYKTHRIFEEEINNAIRKKLKEALE